MAQTATARRLPALPTMTRGRSASNWTNCACGCGQGTQSTFAPGHDARLKGLMIRNLRGVMTLEEIEDWGGVETRKAVEKALKDRRLIERWNLQGDIEDAKARIKAEAEAAEAEEDADADTDDDSDDEPDAAEAE